ncbi:GAF domain-containing protein [Fodinisporobacter ferrooxydans]|uniref:GAF domain-containing protein n=1 Tax=Fodinisporobacter ferrooxydans TaxID=2901836 RepID=A0ABY4CW02_9BACL|nr:GAF domain-containing protein [Alicyclobacillaceae bacterium MYW30-H2]
MWSLQEEIEGCLFELRRLTATDFAAIACSNQKDQTIRWVYVSGNRNDRYKRILLRPGKGIAGKVAKSGRPMVIHSFSPKSGDDPREYPILLAENLKSVVGVPITIEDRVFGILLIGSRQERIFAEQDVELVTNVAEQLGPLLKQQGGIENGNVRQITFYRHMGGHESM